MGLLGQILLYGFAILYWFNPLDLDAMGAAGKVDDVIVALAAMYFARKGLPKGLAQALLSGRARRPKTDEPINPYEILLLPKDAGRDSIIRAYVKQRALYATNRIADMSDEFQRTAERKLEQIERAYQLLMGPDHKQSTEDTNGEGQ